MGKYLLKRLGYMAAMLVAVTIVAFIVMQLPPGDYLTTYINSLEAEGQEVSQAEIDRLRAAYGLDQPMYIQFIKWVSGFPKGDFGYSFSADMPVLEAIMPSFKVSLLIAVIVFIVANFIGHYLGYQSAFRKNTWFDYIAAVIGMIGRSVPAFVLALLALLAIYKLTGQSYAGLYSREFLAAPMSWAKFFNGAKHIFVAVGIVTFANLGFKGLRANMLDEINKPYVVTARAKGMKEMNLRLKYPFRMAMIPSMGTIGLALPGLISGEAITGIVLNLPTLGPLMLGALKTQDMYLAGTILLFQSIMTLVGIFISDIALALIDPRIRLDS